MSTCTIRRAALAALVLATVWAVGWTTSCTVPNPAYRRGSDGEAARADGGPVRGDADDRCGDGRCEAVETSASCPEDCRPCQAGATRCLDQRRLRRCVAGTWRVAGCDAVCVDAGYDYDLGCGYDAAKGKDVCRCGRHATFGQVCQDKQVLCGPGLVCATFGAQGSPGFCTRRCESDQDCLPAPAGSDARCSLVAGKQALCGFHCLLIWGCPKGLTCDLLELICKP
jgi:hypothetical protein